MADIIQIRRDTAANWASVDPTLAQGEFGWEVDTGVLKLGDGSTIYSLLPAYSGTIEVQDDGTPIVAAANTVNFTGGGVTVTDVSGVATVNIPSPPAAPVTSVFTRTGAVVAANGDYTAGQITYNNSGSGLSAITVQAAIDEVEARVDSLEASPAPVTSVFSRTGAVVAQASDYDANQIDYDNTTSGMAATQVQAAIDELEGRVQTNETNFIFLQSGLISIPASGVDYFPLDQDNNNVQLALDAYDARLDILEAAVPPVTSVFGRTGAVTALSGDYDADQVDYDDTGAPITAADVQEAIDAVAPRLAVFQSKNTDTTTNLNTAGLTEIPITGTVTHAGPTGYFTVVGNAVRADVAMRVRASLNVAYSASGVRTNISAGFAVNSVTTGIAGLGGYIRLSNGHNESSVHASEIIDLAANDLLSIFSQQQANASTATMFGAGSSNLIIEVVELL